MVMREELRPGSRLGDKGILGRLARSLRTLWQARCWRRSLFSSSPGFYFELNWVYVGIAATIGLIPGAVFGDDRASSGGRREPFLEEDRSAGIG